MSLFPERPRHSLFPARGGPFRKTNPDWNPRSRTTTWRTSPYEKPIQPPPPPNSEARWSHDLFEDDSNLYGPRVRFHVKSPEFVTFGSVQPSPSLRPFGSIAPSHSTPATSSTPPPPPPSMNSSNPVVLHPIKSVVAYPPSSMPPLNSTSSPPSGLSLLSRIQSHDSHKPLFRKDPSSNLSHATGQPNHSLKPQENKLNEASSLASRRSDQHISLSQSIKLQSQNSRNQHDFDAAMEKYLSGPVILEVANLADGTSAEDVKTAFADFGDIQECTTEEGARQGNQPTLKAKMIFTNKGEAEKAVEALNGALADGLTLAVKIIGRPNKKPERSDFLTATTLNEVKTVKLSPCESAVKLPAQEDVTMEDGEAPPTPTVPTGRLRSEVVAQCDPRASIQVEPKTIPLYRAEQTKPVTRNMFNRVQAFPGNSQPSATLHQHPEHRNGFGITSQSHSFKRNQDLESSRSLLARIKPN